MLASPPIKVDLSLQNSAVEKGRKKEKEIKKPFVVSHLLIQFPSLSVDMTLPVSSAVPFLKFCF